MAYLPTQTVKFIVHSDKVSPLTRCARGSMVLSQTPQSPLCQTHPDLQTGAAHLDKDTQRLRAALDAHAAAEAAFRKATSSLAGAVVAFDGSYDVFLALAEKYCTTDDEGAGLGLAVRRKTRHPLAPPVAVKVTYDLLKDAIRIQVQRAPGMKIVSVQISTNPEAPTSWVTLEGFGATHRLAHPAKGMLWVRAASGTAKALSDYTVPVSVLVR